MRELNTGTNAKKLAFAYAIFQNINHDQWYPGIIKCLISSRPIRTIKFYLLLVYKVIKFIIKLLQKIIFFLLSNNFNLPFFNFHFFLYNSIFLASFLLYLIFSAILIFHIFFTKLNE